MNSERNAQQDAPPECADTENGDMPNMNRRSFFTRTLVGGGAAIATGGVAVGAAQASLEGSLNTKGIEFDPKTFKQMDQRDVILTFAASNALNEKHADRNEQYSRLNNVDMHFRKAWRHFYRSGKFDNSRPGYTQVDVALNHASMFPLRRAGTHESKRLLPDQPFYEWDQSSVVEDQYDFGTPERAKEMMMSAARMFGATRVGISKFIPQLNYDPLYDWKNEKEISWDDFPFKPKSVIVIAIGQDYDAIATSPALNADASVGVGYVSMAIIGSQMAEFLRSCGYKAVASGNDLGNSVAYGIMAGLGEGGRNSQLIVPGLGPRVRIVKIFTEFDFEDAYDQPRTWGIEEFCKSCMKCADSCPSGAISTDVEPSFVPTYEHADEPGYTWNNFLGVKKFHSDGKKCFQFWRDNGGACTNCVASCTFNEPDMWHHWLIMSVNPFAPKFIHALMADAHPAFGYGGQGPIPKSDKLEKFWSSGKGMRTNTKTKDNTYTAGQA